MHSIRNADRTKGFTLIEMAIVLVIVGLIVGLTLPLVTDLIKSGKKNEAERFMRDVKEQIIGYAIMNDGKLPSNLATDLGIGEDPYGNTLTYIVQNDSAGAGTGIDLTADGVLCNTSTTSTDLVVNEIDRDGTTTPVNNVAFIVASDGRNVTSDSSLNTTITASPNAVITHPAQFTSSVAGGSYDDIVEYVTLAYLKNKICSNIASNDAPNGSDVSFADNMSDFTSQGAASGAMSADDAVNVDITAKTVELGNNNNSYACLWYKGTSDNNECTSGKCTWENFDTPLNNDATSLRAYFKFKFNDTETDTTTSSTYGDGFTFIVATQDSANSLTSCGANSESLGYAGGGASANVNRGTGIYPPKIGIEVDTRLQTNGRDGDAAARSTYPQANHVAIVFWADDSVNPLSFDNNDNDDAQAFAPSADGTCVAQSNPARGDTSTGFLINTDTTNFTTAQRSTWLENSATHTMRVEIKRTPYSTCTPGGFSYLVEVWIDSTSGNISNLAVDLGSGDAGTGFYTAKTLNSLESTSGTRTFSTFQFGWSEGTTSGAGMKATISDFGIKFVDD